MTVFKEAEAGMVRLLAAKESCLRSLLRRAPKWMTADQLTVLRILCIFPITYLIQKGDLGLAGIVYCFGSLLDLADGPLARLRGKETEFGKMMDPLADKILADLTLLLILLNQPAFLDPALFWSVVGPDFILIFMGWIGKTMGPQIGIKRRLGANLWGKWKFALQSVAIPLLLFSWARTASVILWATVALSLASIAGHLAFRDPE